MCSFRNVRSEEVQTTKLRKDGLQFRLEHHPLILGLRIASRLRRIGYARVDVVLSGLTSTIEI
jgi:hypothetical protein